MEQPALKAFDKDGDGVLSLEDLRATLANHAQVQEIVDALEVQGIAGIRYTGCDDVAASDPEPGSNGKSMSDEDIVSLIARAAIEQIYPKDGG